MGVRPGTLVGVLLERGAEMIVALPAVLKAGGAYLPLDPGTHPDRLRHTLQDEGRLRHHEQLGGTRAAGADRALLFLNDATGEQRRPRHDAERYLVQRSAHADHTSGLTAVRMCRGRASQRPPFWRRCGASLLGRQTFGPRPLHLPDIAGSKSAARGRAPSGDDRLAYRCCTVIRRDRTTNGHCVTVMQATPATWRLMLGAGWTGSGSSRRCGGRWREASAVRPRGLHWWSGSPNCGT